MTGYWGEPERNRSVFVRPTAAGVTGDLYFRTGDRARLLRDGNLTFVTRSDLQVKVRGHRVELEEVENALLSLDSVQEAAAFTVPDGEGSSAIQSVVVVDSDSWSGRQDLLVALKKLLPSYCVPEAVTCLDFLPRTPTGKVDRRALRDQLQRQEVFGDD